MEIVRKHCTFTIDKSYIVLVIFISCIKRVFNEGTNVKKKLVHAKETEIPRFSVIKLDFFSISYLKFV